MHTVATARAWAIEELRRANVASPVLTADLLLAYVLGWDRIRVLSHTEQKVPGEAWIWLQNLVRRRTEEEPLAYLTGEREFYRLVFRVTPEVLIPRPETEILVDRALSLIRRRLPAQSRFVDVGTGSGCIAVSIAHEIPSATGWAVDISAAALRVARENAIRHGVADRVLLVQADLLGCFPPGPCFDLILCNPPYVALAEYDSLPHIVRDYEPREALNGGESGMEIYRRLIPEVSSRLVLGGTLMLEMGAGQAESVMQMVESAGLSLEMIADDLQGIPRCLVGRKLRSANG